MFKLGEQILATALLLLPFSVRAQEYCEYEADFRLLPEEEARIVGYVEYCFRGEWRSVCRVDVGNWGAPEAAVACRQLGYSEQEVTAGADCNKPDAHYVRLDCEDGRESNLQECGVMAVDDCSCTEGRDFSVYSRLVCIENCTDNEIRLVGGSTDREGRVEVCVDGRWGTVQTNQTREISDLVCDNHSDSLTLGFYSTSSCLVSQFGYSTSKPVYSCSLGGSNGNSTLSCTNSSYNNHSTDLGVLCQSPPDPTQESSSCSSNGGFRLTNGLSNREGRVEVCVDGRWGTVCNNNQEGIAGAVCSQLGFPAQGVIVTSPVVSEWSRSYSCVLGEERVNCMESCCDPSSSLAVNCSSNQDDVIVEVTECTGENRLRLVNGTTYSEGRVEVCKNGSWRSVCDNGQFEVRGRVCSALGFSQQNPQEKWFGAGEGGVSCRLTNNTDTSCEPCDSCCNDAIGVVCQTNQQYIMNEAISTNSLTVLGAVVGILVAVLVAMVIGWTLTCIIWKRRSTIVLKKSRQSVDSTPKSSTPRNERFSLYQLDNELYGTCGPPVPNVATVTEEMNTYAVIGYNQQNSKTPQDKPVSPTLMRDEVVSPTLMRDEASYKEDDFHDTERHTYSVVDKKKSMVFREDDYQLELENASEENPVYETSRQDRAGGDCYDSEQHSYAEINNSAKKDTSTAAKAVEVVRMEPPVSSSPSSVEAELTEENTYTSMDAGGCVFMNEPV